MYIYMNNASLVQCPNKGGGGEGGGKNSWNKVGMK